MRSISVKATISTPSSWEQWHKKRETIASKIFTAGRHKYRSGKQRPKQQEQAARQYGRPEIPRNRFRVNGKAYPKCVVSAEIERNMQPPQEQKEKQATAPMQQHIRQMNPAGSIPKAFRRWPSLARREDAMTVDCWLDSKPKERSLGHAASVALPVLW